MKQKTAVEFAVEKLEKFIQPGNQLAVSIILDFAKEIEKKQIEDAYKDGFKDGAGMSEEFKVEYYNQTYLKESK